ncbi:hypothetical protein COCSADRAFT_244564 [Bipolaris sorokiniana ND90Pr]|uniref:Uncharacterized protein n=1 Tax=Cochliobolus sativus (strain ND90Pr / ATCC 201652) TaxID=665912 RepID=M2SUW7_COCSN|nr:uncharacterized protein COCSADRAFT_244564 [Bipolaris sorokiniana ND90Pr]EMD60587.1 hypothetical protein COCSADRAFT_244564 [Bipolaris sorokiniana ND90Pr]
MFNCRLFNVPCNNLWEIFLANILGLENYDTTSIIPLPKKNENENSFFATHIFRAPYPPPLSSSPSFLFPLYSCTYEPPSSSMLTMSLHSPPLPLRSQSRFPIPQKQTHASLSLSIIQSPPSINPFNICNPRRDNLDHANADVCATTRVLRM